MTGFSFNFKCIVFGFALVMGYWSWVGPRVYFLLFPLIFFLGYVAMAWYLALLALYHFFSLHSPPS